MGNFCGCCEHQLKDDGDNDIGNNNSTTSKKSGYTPPRISTKESKRGTEKTLSIGGEDSDVSPFGSPHNNELDRMRAMGDPKGKIPPRNLPSSPKEDVDEDEKSYLLEERRRVRSGENSNSTSSLNTDSNRSITSDSSQDQQTPKKKKKNRYGRKNYRANSSSKK